MDGTQVDTAVSTRARVRISDGHGWATGREGIAIGYRALYNNIKVGFVDESGEYNGEYTMVPVGSVDLITEEAPAATEPVIEYVSGDAFKVGDVVAYPGRVQAEVTRVGVDGGDLFGRPVKRMYCRAIDGSREGYVDYGPDGKIPRLVKPVTEYSVKIWYRSGAYEGVAHSPEELARKIYADAVKSAGVEFAELHGPSGMLVESKAPSQPKPQQCGEVLPEDSSHVCVLPPGHSGLHRDRPEVFSSLTVSWGDSEDVPQRLTPGS